MSDGRITFVSHTNKPGGGELALRRYLDATSLPVRLVTLEPGGVWDGTEVDVVHAPGLRALRATITGADLVVANSMRAAFLSALVAPPDARLVYWVRDGLTDSAMSRHALLLTKHVTARRTDHFLANSAWTADTVHHALGVERSELEVVRSLCGVPRRDVRPPRTLPSEPLHLLFLGRISPWKAPHVPVRALPPLRELGLPATLTIAGGVQFGEDRYAEWLGGLVAAEPSATMVGHVHQVQALLDSHDILIHSSTVPEPFGQVIVQGLAAGMPVVASRGGGPVEILAEAPVEVLYRCGDELDLARTVRDVVGAYEALSHWAVRRAPEYADEVALAETDRALARVRDKGGS